MKYFNFITSLDDLKKEYRRLSMLNHPDRGGNAETMKAINAEHDEVFEVLKKQHNASADEFHQTTETAAEFREILEILIHLDGLEIELCGSWLWMSGETKQHKDALKDAGCRWSNNKKMWYWHPTEAPGGWKKGRSYSIGEIRTKYGTERITGAGGVNQRIAGATA